MQMCEYVVMLCPGIACLDDKLCSINQACTEFFGTFIRKRIRLSVKTKVPNRLLLVLGVISHRTKSPFVLFLSFLFFTPQVRHFYLFSRFKVSSGRDFSLFLGEFRDNFLFYKILLLSV